MRLPGAAPSRSLYFATRMPTFFDPSIRTALEARVRAMGPDSPRRWGRMTPHQAICHLSDAFRMSLGERTVAEVPGRFKPVMKFVALRLPLPWPRGIPTFREIVQGGGGTPPAEFERDREELLALMARFAAAPEADLAPRHGLFGLMRRSDWGLWAWRHLDHHLRQFGA
jgi:hypothetical protein